MSVFIVGLSLVSSVTALAVVLIYANLHNQFLSALLDAIEKTDIEIRACLQQHQADLNSLRFETRHAAELVKCVNDDASNDRKAFADLRKRFDILDHYIALRDIRSGPVLAANMAAFARNAEMGARHGITTGKPDPHPSDSVGLVRKIRDEWEDDLDKKITASRQAMGKQAVSVGSGMTADDLQTMNRTQAEAEDERAWRDYCEEAHLQSELADLRTGDPAFDLDEAERKRLQQAAQTPTT